MLRYAMRRIAYAIPTLILIAIGVFFMVHLLPGDPVEALVGSEATQEDIEAAKERLGLNESLAVQFGSWVSGMFTGDMGTSYATGRDVSIMIGGALPITVTLAVCALIVCLIIGIPGGIFSAMNKGTLLDKFILGGSLVGISVPSFVMGVLLMLIFAVWLKWFPSSGYVDVFDDPIGGLRALTLPAVSLGLLYAATMARIGRAATLEVVSMDYVDMARASGIPELRVRFRYILKNALIPIITVTGVTFGGLLGGAVVTERVFNLSGIGTLIINSITRRDYPVIQAAVLLCAVIYIVINLLVDILYAAIDPKVHYGDNG